MQINTDTLHTIREASFDEETKTFRFVVYCGSAELVLSERDELTIVEQELLDVVDSVVKCGVQIW